MLQAPQTIHQGHNAGDPETLPPNLQASESLSLIAHEEEEDEEEEEMLVADEKKAVKKSSVSFSTVRIHHHRLSLGDNPGVSSGIPLTLAWEYDASETLKIDDVENEKSEAKKHVHRIPRIHREEIAAERHSRNSIVLAQEQVRELQRSREDSERDPLSCKEVCQKKRAAATNKKKKRGLFGFLFRKRK